MKISISNVHQRQDFKLFEYVGTILFPNFHKPLLFSCLNKCRYKSATKLIIAPLSDIPMFTSNTSQRAKCKNMLVQKRLSKDPMLNIWLDVKKEEEDQKYVMQQLIPTFVV